MGTETRERLECSNISVPPKRQKHNSGVPPNLSSHSKVTSPSRFHRLPYELVHLIFDWLPLSDLLPCALVCRLFHQHASTRLLRELMFCNTRRPSSQQALLDLLDRDPALLQLSQRIS